MLLLKVFPYLGYTTAHSEGSFDCGVSKDTLPMFESDEVKVSRQVTVLLRRLNI